MGPESEAFANASANRAMVSAAFFGLVAVLVGALVVLVDQVGEAVRNLGSLLRNHVGVDTQTDRGVSVAQASSHQVHRHAGDARFACSAP